MRVACVLVLIISLISARTVKKRRDVDSDDSDYWGDIWRAKEAGVNAVTDAKVAKVIADVVDFRDNLNDLLSGGGDKEKMFRHLVGAYQMLQIHEEEGQDTIKPKALPENENCTKEVIVQLPTCEDKFKRIGWCLREGANYVIKTLDDDKKSTVQKVAILKAVVNDIGRGFTGMKLLYQHCYKENHWIKALFSSDDDLKKASAEEVAAVTALIRQDVQNFRDNLDALLKGGGNAEEAWKAMYGALYMVNLHEEKGTGSVKPEKPDTDPQCTEDAINAIEDCGEKFIRIGECLKKGADGMLKILDSSLDVVAKVGKIKGIVHAMGKGTEGIRKLYEYCFGSNHWNTTMLISKEDLLKADKAEIEEVTNKLKAEVKVFRDNLEALLRGEGDRKAAYDHLKGAFQLVQLYDEKGAKSVEPANLPESPMCTADAFEEMDCGKKLERVAYCLKMGADGMMSTLNADMDIVTKVSIFKAIVLSIGRGLKGIEKLYEYCSGDHWEKTILVSENDLRKAKEAEIADVICKLREDTKVFRDNLKALLNGGGDPVAAFRHLEGAYYLVSIHQEKGSESVKPAELQENPNCTNAAFKKLKGCDEQLQRLGRCLKEGADGMMATLDMKLDVVQKVSIFKAIVLAIGRGFPAVKQLVEYCKKAGEPDHWEKTILATEEDLAKATPEEIKKITSQLRADVQAFYDNLVDIESGGDKGTAFKHLDGALYLLMEHEKKGTGSIRAEKLPESKKCSAGAVKALSPDCDAQFKLIEECLKDASLGMLAVIDSPDYEVKKKIALIKGIVFSVAKGVNGIKVLYKYCYGGDHWDKAWSLSQSDLKSMSEADLRKIGENIVKDMTIFEDTLGKILRGEVSESLIKQAYDTLDGAVELAKKHEMEDNNAIQPIPPVIPDNCSKKTIAELKGCNVQLQRIGTCIKAAARYIIETVKATDVPVEQKIGKVKGVVHEVSSGVESIKKLHADCAMKTKVRRLLERYLNDSHRL